MPSEYTGFRLGLIELARMSARQWKDEDHKLATLGLIAVDEDVLDRSLPDGDPGAPLEFPPRERGRASLALLLPPVEGQPQLRCWVAVSWDYGEDKRNGRGGLRLFMARMEEEGMRQSVIRFEDRETGGAWCFAHAQNSDLFAPYSAPRARGMVSATLPRIPLAGVASDSQTLLVTLLLGLYGLQSEIVRRVTGAMLGGSGGDLLRHLQEEARRAEG